MGDEVSGPRWLARLARLEEDEPRYGVKLELTANDHIITLENVATPGRRIFHVTNIDRNCSDDTFCERKYGLCVVRQRKPTYRPTARAMSKQDSSEEFDGSRE